MEPEIRYSQDELRYDEETGVVEGVVMRYGDSARIPSLMGTFVETVRPGAFDGSDDVTLNISHNKQRVFARTGGGGLELRDSDEALTMVCTLPDTAEGRDAREYLGNGTLRGLSVEMDPSSIKDKLFIEGGVRHREISSARLKGIGIVARPAYGDSLAVIKRFEVMDDAVVIETVYALSADFRGEWWDQLNAGENTPNHVPDGWSKDKPVATAVQGVWKSTRKVEIDDGKFVVATRWCCPDCIEKPTASMDEYRFESEYYYDAVETVSDDGAVRKREISSGAFDASIRDPEQEITLSIGRNPNQAIGSKLAGTLSLETIDDRLVARVDNPAEIAAFKDLEAQIQAGGKVFMEPLFRELDGEFEDVPEPGNPDVMIRRYKSVKLYGLGLSIRGRKGQQPSGEPPQDDRHEEEVRHLKELQDWRKECLSV